MAVIASASTGRPVRWASRAICALVAGLLLSCSTFPDVSGVLPQYGPGRVDTAERANAALAAVAAERRRRETEWAARRADCAGSFLASDCAARVQAERRAVSERLDGIALEARRTLRELDAIRRNEAEARRIGAPEAR